LADRLHVGLDLRFEGVQASEFHFGADVVDEFQLEFLAVQVAIEIKQVGFDGNSAAINRGANADVGGSRPFRVNHGKPARRLAAGATLLFVAGFLLWLPISADRLRLDTQAAELIRSYDPAALPEVMVNPGTFWRHTCCTLAALALIGAALALAGDNWDCTGGVRHARLAAVYELHHPKSFRSQETIRGYS
jgi:hypothetical protein